VLGVRGAYVPAAALAFGALAAATLTRRPPRAPRREAPRIEMSEAEARSLLGVGPEADAEAIQSAYVRLMRRVHPDAGGAPGLAVQLNAARDRLLG
jgi:DnaJ-domain-containing protein 1